MEQVCGQKFRVGVKVLKKQKKQKTNKHPPPLTSTRIRNMRLAEQWSFLLGGRHR